MKKIAAAIAACAVFFAASGMAFADNTYGPEPGYDWGGFYVGLNGGYAWSEDDWRAFGVVSNGDGGMLGGTAGFNIDSGDWVFGVEADYGWADVSGEMSGGGCGAPTTSCEAALKTFGTFRIRAGYDVGTAEQGVLLYTTAGLAYGRMKYTVRPSFGEDSGSATGWTVGGGLEYAFTKSISAKLEYLHYDMSVGSVMPTYLRLSPDTKGDMLRVGVNYLF